MTPDHLSLDPKVRAAAARSAEAPKAMLQTLAQDPNVVVRQHVLRVAQHTEDLELLEVFILDPDPVIRAELVLSADCPVVLLRRFRQDPNPAIRGIIDSRLGAVPEEVVEKISEVTPEPEKVVEEVIEKVAEKIIEKAPARVIERTPVPIQVKQPEPPRKEPEPMPEQDEPTGGVNETSRLAPIKVEETPKPGPVPVRSPIVINRPTPLPVRNPIGPGMVRPAPKPFAPPVHPAPTPIPLAPAPAPMAPVYPAPLAETLPAEEPVPIVAPRAASPISDNGQIRIQLTASDKSVSELSFNQDLVVVGRVIGNDIVLPHGNVSKSHCKIFVINGQLYIEDLKSTNGTQLNKANITPREPHILMPTDDVGIGSSTLKISVSYE